MAIKVEAIVVEIVGLNGTLLKNAAPLRAEVVLTHVMGKWPLAIGLRVAPAEQPWGPIRRDGCLRVLARTGRVDYRRS